MYYIVRKATKEKNEYWEVVDTQSFLMFLILTFIPVINTIIAIYIAIILKNTDNNKKFINWFFRIKEK